MTWNLPQQVTVTASHIPVDQPDVTAYLVRHTVTATTDVRYSGAAAVAAADVTVAIADVDSSGFLIDSYGSIDSVGDSVLWLDEDTTSTINAASFSIRMASQPVAPLMVQVKWDWKQLALVSPATATIITFTADNWSSPRTVAFKAVPDFFDEPKPHLSVINITTWDGASTAAGSFKTVGAVKAWIMDFDYAGVQIAFPNRIGSSFVRSRAPGLPDSACLRCIDGTSSFSCPGYCTVYRSISTDLMTTEGEAIRSVSV